MPYRRSLPWQARRNKVREVRPAGSVPRPENMTKIGFIGAGNMAGAIISSLLGRELLPAGKIGIYDVDPEKRKRYAAEGHPVYDDAQQLVEDCPTVVLAVKPQVFPQVLPRVKGAMTPDKLVVSIAAGIGAGYIQNALGFPCKLILVMPNTPLLVGEGATAMSRVEPATAGEFEEWKGVFATAGIVEEIPPDKMNAVMAVHSNTPAFLYLLAKTVAACAERSGIDFDAANRLFCQTMVGSARMMTRTGKTHQELIDMVCSPGGTTLAGLAELEKQGFVQAVEQAFDACVRRAEELAL